VIDPVELRLVDRLVQLGCQRPCGFEVVTERLLDDDPGVLREPRIGEPLDDAAEQEQRFRDQEAASETGDATAEPGDPDYVEALAYGMPPTGGLGLGIDRLAMVLTGRETIRDVILFPTLRERPR